MTIGRKIIIASLFSQVMTIIIYVMMFLARRPQPLGSTLLITFAVLIVFTALISVVGSLFVRGSGGSRFSYGLCLTGIGIAALSVVVFIAFMGKLVHQPHPTDTAKSNGSQMLWICTADFLVSLHLIDGFLKGFMSRVKVECPGYRYQWNRQ